MSDSSLLLIKNVRIYGAQMGWILIQHGKIKQFAAGQPPYGIHSNQMMNAGGWALLPGFIDLHAHGAVGCEAMDGDPEGLRKMAAFYASHGVTSWLASTWAAGNLETQLALTAIQQVMNEFPISARILGAHLEGPYFNPERSGAQDLAAIRRADQSEAAVWFNSDIVKLISLAPEYPENLDLVEDCVQRGIRVAAGHTSATYEQMQAGVTRGIRQVTHCFNAMLPFNHREPGTVGAALDLPELTCELIADNIHVHPAAMRLLWKSKGVEGIILITDAVRAAGLPDGEYTISEGDARKLIVKDGCARLEDGTLAGSMLTMEMALRNFQLATGRPLQEIWPVSSKNAANALGLTAKGRLEPGSDADLVLLDESYNVIVTMVAGMVAYSAPGVL